MQKIPVVNRAMICMEAMRNTKNPLAFMGAVLLLEKEVRRVHKRLENQMQGPIPLTDTERDDYIRYNRALSDLDEARK